MIWDKMVHILHKNRHIYLYIMSCDKQTKQRLKSCIERLPLGNVVKLQGFVAEYRLRVGNLRVLFTYEDNIITINDISSRGQVYKGL